MRRADFAVMSRESLQTLLVRRSILSVEQIGDAVASSHVSGCTWIEHLLLDGILDEDRLADWVSQESKVPRCELTHLATVAPHVIAQIPPEVAYEHRLVPVSIEEDGYLQVAMVDPIDAAAIEEVEFFSGLRIMRQVAVATTVAWALHRYYNARSKLWARAMASATAVSAAAEAR